MYIYIYKDISASAFVGMVPSRSPWAPLGPLGLPLAPLGSPLAPPWSSLASLGFPRSPETTFGAIGGPCLYHFSSDFVVDRAFRRKTPDMQSVCAMAIGLRVAPSATDPKIVRKSLWERLASDCPKSTLTKVDSGPPRRTFRSLRGVQ